MRIMLIERNLTLSFSKLIEAIERWNQKLKDLRSPWFQIFTFSGTIRCLLHLHMHS